MGGKSEGMGGSEQLSQYSNLCPLKSHKTILKVFRSFKRVKNWNRLHGNRETQNLLNHRVYGMRDHETETNTDGNNLATLIVFK